MSSISAIEPTLTSKALSAVEQALQSRLDAMMRIATGNRAESAKDSPSGTGVSMNLSARGARLEADRMSLQNAASFLQTQASVISQMADVFSEVQALTLTIAQGLSVNDPFLTGDSSGPLGGVRMTKQDPSILVQQFYSRVDTLWSLANETFGGVNLFRTEATTEDGGRELSLADGTTVNVTKFNFSSTRIDGSAFGLDLDNFVSLVRMNAPGGSGTSTLGDWLYKSVLSEPGERNQLKTGEAAIAGMIVRNGSEMLAVQDAADRMASYSLGNSVSLGSITDSNLAQDMTDYASSNIRLFASLAMMAQSKVRPTMAFSLITGA
jgi:flagellin-like hook-associated protein FlgL